MKTNIFLFSNSEGVAYLYNLRSILFFITFRCVFLLDVPRLQVRSMLEYMLEYLT